LTQLGEEVALHVESLTDWVEEHTPEILAIRSKRAGLRRVETEKLQRIIVRRVSNERTTL